MAASSSSMTKEKKTDIQSSSPPANADLESEDMQNLQALLGMCLEGYARFFTKYKKYDDAIELYQRALSICENDLMEGDHPHYEVWKINPHISFKLS